MSSDPHTPGRSTDDTGEPTAEPAPPAMADVDELEGRLRDVEAAMDVVQAGDLDAAEDAVSALEARVAPSPD